MQPGKIPVNLLCSAQHTILFFKIFNLYTLWLIIEVLGEVYIYSWF